MPRRALLRGLLVALFLFSTLALARAAVWTERTSSGESRWFGIASSSDGTKLAAYETILGTSGSAGNIWTSSDSGANWTSRASSQYWKGIASSSDGTKLAAVVYQGYLWTSSNSGETWTNRVSTQNWYGIASSSDGTKLAAVVYNGNIWTLSDSGANNWSWNERIPSIVDGPQSWRGIALSSDGTKLAATVNNGNIWTSSDSGETWTKHAPGGADVHPWRGIASSSDGTKIAAVEHENNGCWHVWTSTDFGVTWEVTLSKCYVRINLIDPVYMSSARIASSGDALFAFDQYGRQSYTSKDFATWTQNAAVGPMNGDIESVGKIIVSIASSSDGTKLAFGTSNGYIWTLYNPPPPPPPPPLTCCEQALAKYGFTTGREL
jgi:hypothetical protein